MKNRIETKQANTEMNESIELQAMIKAETKNPEIIEKSESLSSDENINITISALTNRQKKTCSID